MSCRDCVEEVQRHAAGWAMQDLQADIKHQLPCLKSWTKHCCSRKGRGQTFSAVQIQGLSAKYWFKAFPSIREPEEKLLPDQHLFHWHALPLDPEPATDITHILVEHPQTASPKLLPQPHLWPPLTSLSSEFRNTSDNNSTFSSHYVCLLLFDLPAIFKAGFWGARDL